MRLAALGAREVMVSMDYSANSYIRVAREIPVACGNVDASMLSGNFGVTYVTSIRILLLRSSEFHYRSQPLPSLQQNDSPSHNLPSSGNLYL